MSAGAKSTNAFARRQPSQSSVALYVGTKFVDVLKYFNPIIMKLQQSREKLIEAHQVDTTIREIERDIKDLENAIEKEPRISLYWSNQINVQCNQDLSVVIMRLVLQEKRAELKELERDFNSMWKVKRGGSNESK